MNSITIYFSLPFSPIENKTYFYHGHLAIDINGIVYQLFDSNFLKSNFMVSKMPVNDWLYGKSRVWCHNSNHNNKYSHVYLYGCGESYRTKVYYINIQNISDKAINDITNQITIFEEKFRLKQIKFNILTLNCSSFVAKLLSKNMMIKI